MQHISASLEIVAETLDPTDVVVPSDALQGESGARSERSWYILFLKHQTLMLRTFSSYPLSRASTFQILHTARFLSGQTLVNMAPVERVTMFKIAKPEDRQKVLEACKQTKMYSKYPRQRWFLTSTSRQDIEKDSCEGMRVCHGMRAARRLSEPYSCIDSDQSPYQLC